MPFRVDIHITQTHTYTHTNKTNVAHDELDPSESHTVIRLSHCEKVDGISADCVGVDVLAMKGHSERICAGCYEVINYVSRISLDHGCHWVGCAICVGASDLFSNIV